VESGGRLEVWELMGRVVLSSLEEILGWGCGSILGKGVRLSKALLEHVVGDGTRISFWRDLWCGDSVLKVAFPVLFGIACVKNAFVANNMEVLGGLNQWNVNFTREAHDWELEVFASFLQVLHSVRVRPGCEDKFVVDLLQKWSLQGQCPLLFFGL
jgi:hypothetical protein